MSAAHESPTVEVTAELIDTLVTSGGYTHPLFNPSAEDRAGGDGPPLPGQGVLLLMGGLAEQSGALDDAVALLELRRVTFHAMAAAGSSLRVRLEPIESRATSSGKLVTVYRWSALDGDDRLVAEAEAVMLMNPPSAG